MPRLLLALLLAAACAPFAAACLARATVVAPVPVGDAAARPPLAFDQYAVNLRQVPPRPVIQAHFGFTNRGTRPVTITRLEPSCGCLNPRLVRDQRTYHPGEMGRFYVAVHTANESPGPHAYTVKVHYLECGLGNGECGMEQSDSALRAPHSAPDAATSDLRPPISADPGASEQPQRHEQLVTFRLALPEQKVSVEPAEVYFYQLTGEPDERTIYVTDYRGGRLEVTGAACTSELVSLEVLPPETDERGNHRTPIRVSVPGDVPPGREEARITIATSDPEFARVYAAVLIQGPAAIVPVGYDREEKVRRQPALIPGS
jgi:hypothetical protein